MFVFGVFCYIDEKKINLRYTFSFRSDFLPMDATIAIDLTPEQLQTGLIDGTLNKAALDNLLTVNVHENDNIDGLVQFFLQYIPGNRTMDEFIQRSKFLESKIKYNNSFSFV